MSGIANVPSPPLPGRGTSRPVATRWLIAAFVVFAIEATALQLVSGAFQADYASAASDEAAHFVTALMVRDFLASDAWLHPWQFARDYYVHYPKVALGHWPPGFYAALGPWMLVAGTSRAAVLVFMALLAAATATVTFAAGAALVGPWAGWSAAALFLAMPLTQDATGQVMSELAISLPMLLAALQCARAVERDSGRDWGGFALIASAAILTGGSAWALSLVPPLVIALTGRFALLRSPRMWASAVGVLVLCAPWYVATQSLRANEGAFMGGGLAFVRDAVVVFPAAVLVALGPLLSLLAAVGLATRLRASRRQSGVEPVWAALAALAVAKVLVHIALPAGLEARYVLTTLPALLIFAMEGLDRLARRWAGTVRPATVRMATVAAGAAFIALQSGMREPVFGHGYREAAEAQAGAAGAAPMVYVVASDSRGEGSWIAGLAAREPRPSSIVLRGSKLFGVEDWLGRGSKEFVQTRDELLGLLDRVPVNVVIVDTTTEPSEARGYHAGLAAAMASSEAWEPAAVYPLLRRGRRTSEGLRVYRRRTAAAGAPDMALVEEIVLRDGIR